MGAAVERFLTDNPMLLEQVISVLAMIAAGWFARWKRSEYRERAVASRYGRALDVLDAAVEWTGRDFVRDLKAKAADGKLTARETRQALQQARERAIRIGANAGVDFLGELGDDFVDLRIAESVERQKNGQTLLPAVLSR